MCIRRWVAGALSCSSGHNAAPHVQLLCYIHSQEAHKAKPAAWAPCLALAAQRMQVPSNWPAPAAAACATAATALALLYSHCNASLQPQQSLGVHPEQQLSSPLPCKSPERAYPATQLCRPCSLCAATSAYPQRQAQADGRWCVLQYVLCTQQQALGDWAGVCAHAPCLRC